MEVLLTSVVFDSVLKFATCASLEVFSFLLEFVQLCTLVFNLAIPFCAAFDAGLKEMLVIINVNWL